MRIIPRAEWNARPPTGRSTTAPKNRVYYVVHHSGASVTQSVRAIQDWCMNAPPDGRGFSDIDYNFLVRGSTGEIYEGRGWDVVGAHTTGYNTSGAGVCIIGTDQVSDAAKAAVRWLYQQYNQRCGKTLKIRGHRELATTGTDCPGDHVFAWVHAGMPAPDDEEGDMPTPEDYAKAVTQQFHTELNDKTTGLFTDFFGPQTRTPQNIPGANAGKLSGDLANPASGVYLNAGALIDDRIAAALEPVVDTLAEIKALLLPAPPAGA